MAAIVTMTITLDDKGQVQLQAPFEQLMMCYGLLEIARDMCHRESSNRHINKLIAPTAGEVAAVGAKTQ